MQSFSFKYHGQLITAVAEHYPSKDDDCFRIGYDGDYCIITHSGNKTGWVQISNQGERIEPKELIQAMGEGLLQAGIVSFEKS